MKCLKCNDSGWVCENHPNKPFEHKTLFRLFIRECGGAGMPCTCNTHNPPWNYPDKTRTALLKEEYANRNPCFNKT